MGKILIAVADTVFPSLEPARQALGDIDFEIHLAAESTQIGRAHVELQSQA